MSTTAALDRALDDLTAGRPPDPEAGRRVAELAREARAALDRPVQTNDGQSRREAKAQRDQHLIELDRKHCSDIKDIRPKVRRILQWARRYESTGWLRDRHAMACPPHQVGKPEGLIWAALKACSDMPGDRRLHEILSASRL